MNPLKVKLGYSHSTMKLKVFNSILFLVFCHYSFGQNKVSGIVKDVHTQKPISNCEIFDKDLGLFATTDKKGYYEFTSIKDTVTLIYFALSYTLVEKEVVLNKETILHVSLSPLSLNTPKVDIIKRKKKLFALKRLKDVEGTTINAGKKTEVVLVDETMANLASNNARQIYSQVAGLNIYQNDDAGLQLNIGGRGLDPNRTSNFNTKQNGYDISADVLGYPESYYTPAAEALEEIQIIRGAASLQYGTQFGGLINFVMKSPNERKKIELTLRNSIGSNGLFTNFTSLSGTIKKISYYTYINYKTGDGFRPNSEFNSLNAYAHIGYQFNPKTKISAEVSSLQYLSKQGGGLTDIMFKEDPFQSNRERNWFKVNWLLANLKLNHEITKKTNFTLSLFGLNASRDALGFRSNRVDQVDLGGARDLIKGEFQNFGAEARLLSEYKLLGKKAIFLIGSKYYQSQNSSEQGPGSDEEDANFNFQYTDFPNYSNQSQYNYPNKNISVFGENIVYLSKKFSLTPGFRFEYINTGSDGYYKTINTDAAGNVILNETTFENETRERSFILFGLGGSYKPNKSVETYANISQNYRSVTFSDISIVNPAFIISPDIHDEKGFTGDIGIRGNHKNFISYDIGVFGLFYQDRIGFIQREVNNGSIKSERGNVGDAVIYGIESLIDFNLAKSLLKNNKYKFNYYINSAFTDSKYVRSEEIGVAGNKVEFVPTLNIKTGIKLGYKNTHLNIQYSYLADQYSDASNAEESNISGVIGIIPSYSIMDISMNYTYKLFKLEAGVNNVLNSYYFTRRSTGYPGPGIIPSNKRNYYFTLQIQI